MPYLHISGGVLNKRRIWFNAKLGIRPTPAAVRETLFSWLNNDLRGYSCLDLFAGSGILSWEALSWGADRVCLVEKKRWIYHNLCVQADTINDVLPYQDVRLIHSDALGFLAKKTLIDAVDLIFVDPPYETDFLMEVLQRLSHHYKERTLITEKTLIYYEMDKREVKKIEGMRGFIPYKKRRRGQFYFGLLRAQ